MDANEKRAYALAKQLDATIIREYGFDIELSDESIPIILAHDLATRIEQLEEAIKDCVAVERTCNEKKNLQPAALGARLVADELRLQLRDLRREAGEGDGDA
jgi:hypothetical protein